jgi:hypothetical protein
MEELLGKYGRPSADFDDARQGCGQRFAAVLQLD